jgi:hypothetical protein
VSYKAAGSRPDELDELFSDYLNLAAALGPVTLLLTEMSNRSRGVKFLRSGARPVLEADDLTARYDSNV